MPRTTSWLVSLFAALTMACETPSEPTEPTPITDRDNAAVAVSLRLDTLETGLSQPVFVTWAPGDDRLYVVEKTGTVRLRTWRGLLSDPFLDLTGLVSSGNEQGLLGLAFHPGFETNRLFYVNYTDVNGDTRVVEYRAWRNRANPGSARLVLFVDQPAANHNGGMMAFGQDGFLYIAFGDGGGTNRANGQRMDTLLGKIIRIDVDGVPYAIPPDNPYVGVEGVRPEIWHSGLRNPWRFSFDRGTGRMFIADVGQNTYEEVNIVPAGASGRNFGWSTMEGPACFNTTTCDQAGLALPQHWYTHAEGCSITGGYVYRGSAVPGLRGAYFFADFCRGAIKTLRMRNGSAVVTDWSDQLGTVENITSFGEGRRGAFYVTTIDGLLLRLGSAG